MRMLLVVSNWIFPCLTLDPLDFSSWLITCVAAAVAKVLLWSRIEPCCSVIAACLPTLGPLFRDARSPESVIRDLRAYFSTNRSTRTGNLSRKKSSKTSEDSQFDAFAKSDETKPGWIAMPNTASNTIISHHQIAPMPAKEASRKDGIFVEAAFLAEQEGT